jgi:molybdopterin/thiamine biosynthesis adenylyltransferase
LHLLDEPEFTPGQHGYRQITPAVLARLGNRAAEQRLALVTCHSHPGATTRNRLSRDDREGHERVFPHLLDIVDGQLVGGIAFGSQSAAGEIWMPGPVKTDLEAVEVVGHRLHRLTPAPPPSSVGLEARFDRQARMFGADGQALLRRMRVTVIGLGGGGSMVVEQLAHLGVGGLVAVDYDVVQAHNLSRIVGATPADAASRRKKVAIAQELVARIDPSIAFEAIDGDLADARVAARVADTDFIFLCTDTMTSRLVANAIVHTQLVPMVQIGAKVDLLGGGQIESIYVAVRPVFPGRGCLACAGLIDPAALQRETATDEERAAQNYLGLPEVVDPSVITLNGVAASTATNLMLMSSVGLAADAQLDHRLFDARDGSWLSLKTTSDPLCRWCGRHGKSGFGRGQSARLPVRLAVPEDDGLGQRSFFERLLARLGLARDRVATASH